jgi:hypothetical protein
MTDDTSSGADPCRATSTFSAGRFLAFTLLFVVAFGGGVSLFVMLGDTPYGIQLGSVVVYTALVIVYSFAKNRGNNPPYLFTCPVVKSQYPRLLKWHAVYVAVLVTLETVALRITPHLSQWWLISSGTNETPFMVAVVIPCGVLAVVEIMTNRGVLERAHRRTLDEESEARPTEARTTLECPAIEPTDDDRRLTAGNILSRLILAALGIAPFGYGVYGLWTGELALPKRSGGGWMHLTGTSAVLTVAAFACVGVMVVTPVFFGNTDKYPRARAVQTGSQIAAVVFLVINIVRAYWPR